MSQTGGRSTGRQWQAFKKRCRSVTGRGVLSFAITLRMLGWGPAFGNGFIRRRLKS
jgi:hypothetical protein